MKEKLLALLVAKFVGVPEAMLEGIAAKKAGSVSDEAQLQSIADGIDFVQVLQSNVDKRITESNRLAVQNYETTHKLVNGKPVSVEPPKVDDPNDIKTIVANAIKDAITPLQSKIESYEKKDTQSAMYSKLKTTLGNKVPESYYAKRGITIESEEQLTSVATEIESDWTSFRQEQINAGVMIDKPASGQGPVGDANALASQIEAGTQKIIEQSKK